MYSLGTGVNSNQAKVCTGQSALKGNFILSHAGSLKLCVCGSGG